MIDVARGGFLSDNDRSVLDRFPVEIAAEDLIRCFSLGEHDLESCVLYKQALDQHLPPEISDIVMSVNSGEDGYANYRRDRDAEETGMAIWISNHKATIASEITNTNRSGYFLNDGRDFASVRARCDDDVDIVKLVHHLSHIVSSELVVIDHSDHDGRPRLQLVMHSHQRVRLLRLIVVWQDELCPPRPVRRMPPLQEPAIGMPVRRREPLPHCGGRRPVFRCAGGGDTFDERAALRAQLDTGQRLQRTHGARLFYGRQKRQERALAAPRRCDSTADASPAANTAASRLRMPGN